MDLLPLGERTVVSVVPSVGTARGQLLALPPLLVDGLGELGESPVARGVDLLTAGELHLGSSEGLNGASLMLVLAPQRHQGLSDVHSGDRSLGLSEGTSHTGLEPVSASTRQHLVDSEHVEGVLPHSDMEGVLSAELDHVLVSTDTGSLQGLRGQLLLLVGDQMDTRGEIVNMSLLPSEIVDPNLGVRDTTAEPGLGVGLVLAVPVTPGWTATHGYLGRISWSNKKLNS